MIELGMDKERISAGLRQTWGQVKNQVRPGVNVRNIVGLNILVMFILMATQETVEEGQVEEKLDLIFKGKISVGEIVKEAERLIREGGREKPGSVALNKEELLVLEEALSRKEKRREELKQRIRGEVGKRLEESEVERMITAFSREKERLREGVGTEVEKILEESGLREEEKRLVKKAMAKANWKVREGERVETVEGKIRGIVENTGVKMGKRELRMLRAVGVRVAAEESILGERARASVKIGEEKRVGAGILLEAKMGVDAGFKMTGERLLRTVDETERLVFSGVLSKLVAEERLRAEDLEIKEVEERLERVSGEMGIEINREEIGAVWEYAGEEKRIEEAMSVAVGRFSEETGIGVDGSVEMISRMAVLAARGEEVVGIHEELKGIGKTMEGSGGRREEIRDLNTVEVRRLITEGVKDFKKLDGRGVVVRVARGVEVKNELLRVGASEEVSRRIGEESVEVIYGSPFEKERKRRSVVRKLTWANLGAYRPRERQTADKVLEVLQITEQVSGLDKEGLERVEKVTEEYGKNLIEAERETLGNPGSIKVFEELNQIKTAGETAVRLVPKSVKARIGGRAKTWFFTKTAIGNKIWRRGARILIKNFGKAAVKQGLKGMSSVLIKKVATWGASALAAAPSLGVSLIIMAGIEVGAWVIKKVWKPVKNLIIKAASFLGIKIKKLGMKEMLLLGGGALVAGGVLVPVLVLPGILMLGGGLLAGGGLAVIGGSLAAFVGGLGAGLMTIGAPIALAVGIGLGAIFFFHKGVMDKAAVLAPLNEEKGSTSSGPPGSIPGLGGKTTGTSCMDHLACRVQNTLARCTDGQGRPVTAWTRSSDEIVKECMREAGIPNSAINTMSLSADGFTYLQCVGFKVAVEGHFNGGHNAEWFARNTPSGCCTFRPEEAEAGDNVAWGPGASCRGGSCSNNIACCGHIGVLTQNLGGGETGGINWFLYTSANGANGTMSTTKLNPANAGVIFSCDPARCGY